MFAWADLKFLESNNPVVSLSQIAGFTGMCHYCVFKMPCSLISRNHNCFFIFCIVLIVERNLNDPVILQIRTLRPMEENN